MKKKAEFQKTKMKITRIKRTPHPTQFLLFVDVPCASRTEPNTSRLSSLRRHFCYIVFLSIGNRVVGVKNKTEVEEFQSSSSSNVFYPFSAFNASLFSDVNFLLYSSSSLPLSSISFSSEFRNVIFRFFDDEVAKMFTSRRFPYYNDVVKNPN